MTVAEALKIKLDVAFFELNAYESSLPLVVHNELTPLRHGIFPRYLRVKGMPSYFRLKGLSIILMREIKIFIKVLPVVQISFCLLT